MKWFVSFARFFAWLFGVPYCLQMFARITFMIREGGMEQSDGMGSPAAFVFGMVGEFIFLGFPALLLAGFVRCQTLKSRSDQIAEPRLSGSPFSVEPPLPPSPRISLVNITNF